MALGKIIIAGRSGVCDNCGAPVAAGSRIDWQGRIAACESCKPELKTVEASVSARATAAPSRAFDVLPGEAVANRAKLLAKLDPDQQQVAAWRPKDGNMRVVAAAGSGKTTTTVALVSNLLEEGIPATKLVVTTFTKKAGKELEERLAAVTTPAQRAGMLIGTNHSIFIKQLVKLDPKRWDFKLNCSGTSRLDEMPHADTMWKYALSHEPIKILDDKPGLGLRNEELREALKTVPLEVESQARANNIAVDDARNEKLLTPVAWAAWKLYEEQKRAWKAYDFADVLSGYLPHAAASAGGRIVIIDEAQDNTNIQVMIAVELAKNGGNVVLVGDVRQAIYQWRGADPDLFLHADKAIEAKRTLWLPNNYRSCAPIVNVGNNVAHKQSWMLGDPAVAARSCTAQEGGVTISEHEDLDAAAFDAATLINEARKAGAAAKDFAVLCRTKAMQGTYEAVFINSEIPAVVVGGSSFFNSRAWKAYIGTLACIASRPTKDDIKDMVRAQEGLGKTSAEAAANAYTNDIFAALKTARGVAYRAAQRDAFDTLIATLAVIRAEMKTKENREAKFQSICDGVMKMYLETPDEASAENGDDDENGAYANARAIVMRFAADPTSPVAAAKSFADRCRGKTKSISEDDATQSAVDAVGAVIISTIHKAKGLEWKTVFIDATDGNFPLARSEEDKKRSEEEKRLFYVGVTRAKDSLHLTYCRKRFDKPAGPSKYLRYAKGEAKYVESGDEGANESTFDEPDPAPAPVVVRTFDVMTHGQPPEPIKPSPLPLDRAGMHMQSDDEGIRPDVMRLGIEADIERAKQLSDKGTQPEPGERSVPVKRTEMEELLQQHGFEEIPDSTSQRIYEAPVGSGGVKVRIYSSIPRNAEVARGSGDDSIKVTLMGPKGKPLMKKQPYAARTRNWRVTLLQRIIEALKHLGGPCQKCGSVTAERTSKTSGKTFYGCVRYPECDGFGK